MNHLVLLPCHGIWKGGPTLGEDQGEWHLASFQLDGRDHLCFKEHVTLGLAILEKDPNAILVISGGMTKADAGKVSEAEAYFRLLEGLADDTKILDRVILEAYALDSFENVLFSLCRFYEHTDNYPQNMTIVGFEFKRHRFLRLHLQALLFPGENVKYIGNSPSPSANHKEYFDDLDRSEYEYAVKLFEKDWYGVRDPLKKKKNGRNPFKMSHSYHKTNQKLVAFFWALENGTGSSNEELQQHLAGAWSRVTLDD